MKGKTNKKIIIFLLQFFACIIFANADENILSSCQNNVFCEEIKYQDIFINADFEKKCEIIKNIAHIQKGTFTRLSILNKMEDFSDKTEFIWFINGRKVSENKNFCFESDFEKYNFLNLDNKVFVLVNDQKNILCASMEFIIDMSK